MSTLTFEETAEALHLGVVGRVVPRAVIVVRGPDARSYLQGQVSQDLLSLTAGEGAEALLLNPSGKLDAYVRVIVRSDEELLVDVDPAFGQAALVRLARFKLRVKATLELLAWSALELRGPGATAIAPPGIHGDAVAVAVSWPGIEGVDVIGPEPSMPEGVPIGAEAALEVARIEAGWPLMGSELTEKTIAAEANLVGRTVSFTKGCYTGQELIARLDARGTKVPFRLHGFVVGTDSGRLPARGDALLAGEKEVGEVTSVAYSPVRGAVVGLAYIKREITAPAELTIRSISGELIAKVEELPLTR